MKGRKGYMKNRRISWGEKGNKMKVSFEWREGNNGVSQLSFLYENNLISKFEGKQQ